MRSALRFPYSAIHSAEVVRQKEGKEHRPVGRPTVLTDEQERWLAAWIRLCARLGAPVRKCVVFRRAKLLAAQNGRTFSGTGGLPGRKWWERFRQDFKLKERKPAFRHKAAHQALTAETLGHFYDLLFAVITTYNIPPELIWGADEVGFQRTDANCMVVTGQEVRKQELVGTSQTQHISLMSLGSARGHTLEPFVLCKGQGQRISSNPIADYPEHSAVVYTRKLSAV